MRTKLMTLAAENGFSHAAAADMSALTPRREVREMCRADRCGQLERQLGVPAGLRHTEGCRRGHPML